MRVEIERPHRSTFQSDRRARECHGIFPSLSGSRLTWIPRHKYSETLRFSRLVMAYRLRGESDDSFQFFCCLPHGVLRVAQVVQRNLHPPDASMLHSALIPISTPTLLQDCTFSVPHRSTLITLHVEVNVPPGLADFSRDEQWGKRRG